MCKGDTRFCVHNRVWPLRPLNGIVVLFLMIVLAFYGRRKGSIRGRPSTPFYHALFLCKRRCFFVDERVEFSARVLLSLLKASSTVATRGIRILLHLFIVFTVKVKTILRVKQSSYCRTSFSNNILRNKRCVTYTLERPD